MELIKMKQFDLISDIHLDFWVDLSTNPKKMQKKIGEFIKSILPEETSDVLVIAGDLGHYNAQNVEFLKQIKEHYKQILLVFGNHDYYMISNKLKEKYKNDSIKRANEMKELAEKIEGVKYLTGQIVEIDGIKFGGTGMWFDFSFGLKRFGTSLNKQAIIYKDNMNDLFHMRGKPTESLGMFWDELNKLDGIIEDSDVIVTHYGSDWSKIPLEYQDDPNTSFYYFDGSKYRGKLQGKVWCFGHTHQHYSYVKDGCWYVNAALGYPNEYSKGRKIVNIPV